MRFLFLLLTFPLFGAYVGNPASPALMNTGFFSSSYPFFKFTSGYTYDYTENKRFVSSDDEASIKKFGLYSQLASFSLIFIERLQFFGTAGGSKELVKEQPIYEMLLDVHTNYHLSWSGGAKIILFQWGQTFFSADFTYFAIPSSHKSYLKFLDKLDLPKGKQEFSLEEYQASFGLSSRFYFLTPYVGASYLKSKLHVNINYHNDVNFGYFYGLTLSLTGRLHVNFERRLRDEFAYTFATIGVF